MTIKDELLNAVTGYAVQHQGSYPYLTGTYSISGCTDCHIVDIAALLTSNGGMLQAVPYGTYAAAGSNNDNCDGGAYGCSSSNHYIWLIDLYGNIYSKCVGAECSSNDATGYQGVWP